LVSHVFTPARIAVLKLLASQAASHWKTLVCTATFADARRNPAPGRRQHHGILIFEPDGRIIEANRRVLRMVGYDRGGSRRGPTLRWTDLTPPEWRTAPPAP